MKKSINKKHVKIISAVLFILFIGQPLFSYIVTYKEQYYRLFHVHFQQYPDDVMENIYWLEKAVEADFCNPKYALSTIETTEDWEKYRYIFMMHVNLKLIEQHLRLGANYDKQSVYFYDAPFRAQYISDLEKTKSCYEAGLYYWKEAKLWAEKASQKKFYFLYLKEIQNWEDERYRVIQGTLNYENIINREIERVTKLIDDLLAMDENTY